MVWLRDVSLTSAALTSRPFSGQTGKGVTRVSSADPESIHELLFAAERASPAAYAVTDDTGRWTYAELASAVRTSATLLARLGVRRGDRVVATAASTRAVVALLHACSAAGAVFVPLNPSMKWFQIEQVLTDAEPALIVTADGGKWSTNIFVLPISAFGSSSRECADAAPAPARADDLAVLLYTSGTTSPKPKAVVSRHRQMMFATAAIAECLSYRAEDVVLCRLPLSFDYGLYQVLLCAQARAEIVLCGLESDARLIATARRTGATVLPVVPSLATMIINLLRRDTLPLDVRLITNTGEHLPATLIAALRDRVPGAAIQLMFGLTECKRVTIMEPDGDLLRPGSVGRALPGTMVTIIDQSGAAVRAGEVGEIVVRGEHVMDGYWRAPELSAQVFRADRNGGHSALHTGDYGWLDAEGYLYFVGRRDQLFKRNGMRMSMIEIEAAARDIPGVADAVVLLPDSSRDAVLLVVTDLRPTEVRRAMRERLSPEKVPSDCRVVAQLARSANGKIDRAAMATSVNGTS